MYRNDGKYKPFEKKVWLSSPTMYPDSMDYVMEAYKTNWMSTVGKNISEVEKMACEKVGCKYAVALSCGTAALHMAVKLAGVKRGDKVFCSDMTFDATVNPVVYEGGVPIFIDTEYDTWNMDPMAIEKAFEIYPDVRVVVVAHLYGTPGKIDEIKAICDKHGAVIVEDAAESFGATYQGICTHGVDTQTGSFGTYNAISFNGNKIISGSSGGMLLTDDEEAANKVRKWSTQSRENAPWYQHEELGYNYRMSNLIAGVVRGQMPHLEEHIGQKKTIYERYKEGFKGIPVKMNPYDAEKSEPNFWLSCLIIEEDAMCKQVRGECEALYNPEHGKSCPTEILEALSGINAEGRPIWKPMHMQPIYRMNEFVTREGNGWAKTNAYINVSLGGVDGRPLDVGMDIFHRGLCLPSDNKMTEKQQDRIIEVVNACFK
ncbi:aminotransferase class V-fold PLP-dependent enzyme [Ruminococcus sp. OA3]|uniref:DegT/DnrJ/EryC1/StrS family aminotransferase n=1 Tax=Ruminococcus sp. OA3 TaxID=2914164 RepID=UPI001F064D70|nr:aminotransferase class V-fold PLP-dependent enzyme [Ruminococcus sp. OA3]MCH1982902.1 aminotransferase class V-fold PLP-dependent enzyme [Ruminococcus sp. OA3]